MKVFDLELTIDELEIIRLSLTKDLGTSTAIAFWAKDKGKDVKAVLDLARRLYEKFNRIIEENTL